MAVMFNKHVPLFETARIKQDLQAFARRQLAFLVLCIDTALAAAQTRLAASEAELAGLLEALAQTRRDVAETRRVVDDESKASVASSIGE